MMLVTNNNYDIKCMNMTYYYYSFKITFSSPGPILLADGLFR